MQTNFNLGDKFNYEKDVSLSLELDKTCYSKGELIKGTITLTPSQNSKHTELLNPFAKMSFQEKQNYDYINVFHEKDRDIIRPTKKNIQEIISLGSSTMNFSNYENAKLFPSLKIPFQIRVPNNAYPSCFFEPNCYVIHFLTCEFESLQVKKSVMIIIKNNYYFSKENQLLKIPTIEQKTITKHKFGVFSCGYFNIKITLEKNICPYTENLPITIDIDCSKLKMIILKGVKIIIYRIYSKNNQKNKNFIQEKKEEEIVRKTLPLREGEKKYHIEDSIKLPISSNDLNPEEIYKLLDNDKKKENQKFENIRLFPSCSGGLLSCKYFIKILFETNTIFSTNEDIDIFVDFYSPFNDDDSIQANNNGNINNIDDYKNENLNIKNEVDIDNNLKINQEAFINDFLHNQEENEKGNKINDNNINDFQILKYNS